MHELVHVLLSDYDFFNEKIILKDKDLKEKLHDKYMIKLEATVHHLTEALTGRKESKGE